MLFFYDNRLLPLFLKSKSPTWHLTYPLWIPHSSFHFFLSFLFFFKSQTDHNNLAGTNTTLFLVWGFLLLFFMLHVLLGVIAEGMNELGKLGWGWWDITVVASSSQKQPSVLLCQLRLQNWKIDNRGWRGSKNTLYFFNVLRTGSASKLLLCNMLFSSKAVKRFWESITGFLSLLLRPPLFLKIWFAFPLLPTVIILM